MSTAVTLKGITWNHSRGFVSVVATAQRYMDEHPEVEISWHKRSLKDFGDFPLEKLTDHFDLLIIDHPFVGYAATHPVLQPLDMLLPTAYLADQAANSVGLSYPSYVYGDHLWALPVDAATPISGWRPDLLARNDATIPTTWDELLALASRGLVILPAVPTDAASHYFMLCNALSPGGVFPVPGTVTDSINGCTALELLRELVSLCDPLCLDRNPIRTWEVLARSDNAVYCPFAYGYANYGRRDYTDHVLQFGGLVTLNEQPLRSMLGGTGLAISTRVQEQTTLQAALDYVAFTVSPATQQGLYTVSGGQPGHRQAWLNSDLDLLCNGFFADTLQTLDAAWLRPRHPGYNHFQDAAGVLVNQYLRAGGDPGTVFAQIEQRYRESLQDA